MKKLIDVCRIFLREATNNVIRQVTDAIESVDGVSLLDVDPGRARTGRW